jgi:flagellar biosynthesis protein FlhF
MNVNRFTARTSREALALVKQAFGSDAVVLSTRPCAEGVEVLAMASDGMQHIERMSVSAPAHETVRPRIESGAGSEPFDGAQDRPVEGPAARNTGLRQAQPERSLAPAERTHPAPRASDVAADVERLSMSTLSFQDYVRERMLKRRQAALQGEKQRHVEPVLAEPPAEPPRAAAVPRAVPRHEPPVLQEEIRVPAVVVAAEPTPAAPAERAVEPVAASRRDAQDVAMMNELREMKGLIEERFGVLAFMDRMQRQPAQARLAQKLLDAGFSPALTRKLADGMAADIGDETAWASAVLERNLATNEHEPALEDQGGVYALIGSTGVGKTTSTAKIAAAFAAKYGAANLGLVTLDAYRVGAHEQLRAYGRILGVPVHTAHDRVTLEDLLDLLSAKKMVLIDTAGIGQRDARTRELLDMLGHRAINKLLVVNAAAQGETIEDVLLAYRASQCAGVVLSKLDEALKLGPALDALIRHKLKVVGVANGQRVPEDWHRLSAQALVHRALRTLTSNAWRIDASDVNLVFAAARQPLAGALHD